MHIDLLIYSIEEAVMAYYDRIGLIRTFEFIRNLCVKSPFENYHVCPERNYREDQQTLVDSVQMSSG